MPSDATPAHTRPLLSAAGTARACSRPLREEALRSAGWGAALLCVDRAAVRVQTVARWRVTTLTGPQCSGPRELQGAQGPGRQDSSHPGPISRSTMPTYCGHGRGLGDKVGDEADPRERQYEDTEPGVFC